MVQGLVRTRLVACITNVEHATTTMKRKYSTTKSTPNCAEMIQNG